MRELVAGLAAAALLAGCGHTTRYTTTSAALQEARLADRSAFPATRDGDPVWIATDRVASERWLPDGTAEVEARDPGRGLRIGGWILGGTGLAFVGTGFLLAMKPSRGGDGFIFPDSLALATMGVPFLLGGAGLLIPGYLTDGPEVPPQALVGAALLIPGYAGSGPEAEPPHFDATAPPRR